MKTKIIEAIELKKGDYVIIPKEKINNESDQIGRVEIRRTILHDHRKVVVNYYIKRNHESYLRPGKYSTTEPKEKFEKLITERK